MRKKSLRVAAFFDGRAGHEKQTQGILTRLEKLIDLEVVNVTVRKPPIMLQILDWIKYLTFDISNSKNTLAGCDLLIGTGTHTHLPMLQVKKKLKTPVLVCMTPSSLLLKKFDLIFSPQHDNAGSENNVFTTIGPPSCCIDFGRHDSSGVLILIGGTDSKSHVWNSQKLMADVRNLVDHDLTKLYTISSSPRTPEETTAQLSAFADEKNNVEFFDFNDTPNGWVEKEYNRNKYVWVTGDSISMVYEALSSGCQVGIIPVKWNKADSKFSLSENYLTSEGHVVLLKTYLKKTSYQKHSAIFDEAQRCAEEIVRRWA